MAEFSVACWHILLELAPWLLLGALVAGVLHDLLPADFLKRQLSGSLGVFKAVTLGVPLPLCSCSVIPVGLSIKQVGASDGATVAFLISTPQTGVDSILVSAAFLGWPFALFKVASAAVTGLLGGWWTNLKDRPTLPIVAAPGGDSSAPVNRWVAVWLHSLELLRSIWRWLVLGVVVSAAITAFVPTNAMSALANFGGLAAMVVTLIVALPLYVCATASVPIAAALVASGLPVGAALVFLMAGPATNMATIGAVYRALGRRALTIYLTTVIVGSILCGWLFGFLIRAETVKVDHLHETGSWWSLASAVLLLALIVWFACQEFLLVRKQTTPSPAPGTTVEKSCCK